MGYNSLLGLPVHEQYGLRPNKSKALTTAALSMGCMLIEQPLMCACSCSAVFEFHEDPTNPLLVSECFASD